MDFGAMFWILLNHEPPQLFQVVKVPSERDCNVVHFVLEPELDDVVFIVTVDCRERN